MDDGPTIVFAAGGTGGHIYPALAVAETLRTLAPRVRCVIYASDRAIDDRILSAHDYPWLASSARPFGLTPGRAIRFLSHWGGALRQSRALLAGKTPQAPRVDALLVTGGFVSAPIARAAKLERVPTVLLNLDAIPGKASRLVARQADVRLTTFDSDATPRQWERIPPVVRPALLEERDAHTSREALGLDPDEPLLLVTGGSQGARTLNEVMLAYLRTAHESLENWQVLHQAGTDEDALEELREAYEEAGVRASVVPYVERMDLAWNGAELALSRAGAGAVGEAWATRTPTVFLPYPFHADHHQVANARVLVDAGAARLVMDEKQTPRTLHTLAPLLDRLLTSAADRMWMTRACEALGPANGGETAAERVLALIDRSPRS